MRTNSSKIIISISFGFGISLLCALVAIWLINISENRLRYNDIINKQTAAGHLFNMRDAAYQRSMLLLRMSIMEDEFLREDDYEKFLGMGSNFISARDQLLAMPSVSKETRMLWEKVKPDLKMGTAYQHQSVKYLLNDKIDKAQSLLINDFMPVQTNVFAKLTEMFDVQKTKVKATVAQASTLNERHMYWLSTLGGMGILLAVGISLFVIRRTTYTEASLVRARETALHASQHKSDFLAKVSHEFRTPLNAIIGYTELIKDEASEQYEDFNVSDLDKVLGAAGNLLVLINDVLDISKIEAGKMELINQEFDLQTLIHNVVSTIKPLVTKNANKLHTDIDPNIGIIFSDHVKIKQVLFNLISNACKYTKEGDISVAITQQITENERIISFKITDTGIGISPSQQKHIFEPFMQADRLTANKYGGTGLGLAICQCFCELMGGTLSVTSQPGKGSTFEFQIPTISEDNDFDIDSHYYADDVNQTPRFSQSADELLPFAVEN